MDLAKCVLGIELGSTRIKAVLLDENNLPAAQGAFEWENRLENGIWTYDLEDAVKGVRACYAELKQQVKEQYGITITTLGAIGISGMMHGYIPIDIDWEQLAPFRTWRNTVTAQAAEKLTALFGFNIPQRWSVAHYYQAMLNKEPHVEDVDTLFTLAGYIQWLLTDSWKIGIGEASGMFPIDSETLDYDAGMLEKFKALTGKDLKRLLPAVLPAGEIAGYLTPGGAKTLDPEGDLLPGVPFAPCEGDAGTGMVATNAVRVNTGNVSAGTSDFAMIVTDRPLGVHTEIDMVTTPAGDPVAMVHCNNCTSDINAWVNLFGAFAERIGAPQDKGQLFQTLFSAALEGEADCGGLMSYNYLSGEGITGMNEGRPVFLRKPDAAFTLPNFMRTHLYSALATLKLGMDILTEEEHVKVQSLRGHGGYFKTPGVGQRMLSAAVNAPVTVMETAGEGGPYGMALLAAYMLKKEAGESLADFLDNKVFANAKSVTVQAEPQEVAGFAAFCRQYKAALGVEQAAVKLY